VAVGKYLYLTNWNGVTTVLVADREFCRLAENETGKSVHATLASAGGQLYARDETHVVCLGGPTSVGK
jgi:hypothetical protein